MSCVICGITADQTCLHQHHVIPQARGGANGPVVAVCAKHHTLIHAVSVKLSTAIKNGQDLTVASVWPEPETLALALPLVQAVVMSSLSATNKQYKVVLEFDQRQREMLDLLKHEFGVSSIKKAIYACLDATFRARF